MSAAGDRHFEQARWNRDFAEQTLRDFGGSQCHVQWVVTSAFYCAVHCMQGYLVNRGLDPKSHAAREDLMADPINGVPQQVFRAYMFLSQTSKRARYRCGVFAPAWVQSSIIDGRLRTIASFVNL